MIAGRVAAAALAACAVVVAILALRGDHRCSEVKAQVARAPAGRLAAIAEETAQRCGDPRDSAVLTVVLTARGQRATALQLARHMTRAHPDDYLGWLIVWRLSGDQRAHARAAALDPRGTPS
ncbi:MAG: hypothetical protein V7607_4836 [Solirubrobacteraceae bacterium]